MPRLILGFYVSERSPNNKVPVIDSVHRCNNFFYMKISGSVFISLSQAKPIKIFLKNNIQIQFLCRDCVPYMMRIQFNAKLHVLLVHAFGFMLSCYRISIDCI